MCTGILPKPGRYSLWHRGGDGVKRGEFPESEVRLVKSVEQEFELFKYKMLSGSRQNIFDSCNEIRFYCCVHEYWLYAENKSEEHIRACLNYEGSIIAAMYNIYLGREYLRCSRFQDIEEILDAMVCEQEKYGVAGPSPEYTEKQQEADRE